MKRSFSKSLLAPRWPLSCWPASQWLRVPMPRGGRRWRRRWWWRWWRRCPRRWWWRRRPGAGAGRWRWRRRQARSTRNKADARTNNVRSTSVNNVNNVNNVNAQRQRQRRTAAAAATTAGTTTITRSRRPRRSARGRRDVGRHRLDGAHRAARLRAGQLRRHGLPAMRQHLVSAPGVAVHRGQSTVLMCERRGRRSPRSSICPASRFNIVFLTRQVNR